MQASGGSMVDVGADVDADMGAAVGVVVGEAVSSVVGEVVGAAVAVIAGQKASEAGWSSPCEEKSTEAAVSEASHILRAGKRGSVENPPAIIKRR